MQVTSVGPNAARLVNLKLRLEFLQNIADHVTFVTGAGDETEEQHSYQLLT